VQTQPRAESRAAANLERQGFFVFYPRLRKTLRHARVTKQVLVSLFPSYIFVRRDVSAEAWRSINGTFGVVRLVANGDTPRPVPHGVVESLQARATEEGTLDWMATLHVGQAVRIVNGPLTDFCGQLEQLHDSGRVKVLLDLLGRSVSVETNREALELAV
jgi:transcriptional antiterminator RfaH